MQAQADVGKPLAALLVPKFQARKKASSGRACGAQQGSGLAKLAKLVAVGPASLAVTSASLLVTSALLAVTIRI